MTRFRTLQIATVAAALTFAHFASAQDVAARTADALFKEGKEAGKRGDAEKARENFATAYRIEPTAPTLWNLALAEKQTGRSVEALRHFRKWMRDWTKDTKGGTKLRDQTKAFVDELTQKTGHLTFEAPAPATLSVDGQDTAVAEDGRALDVIDIPSGHHAVEAKVEARTLKQEIDVAAGATVTLHFAAEAPPAPAPAPVVAVVPVQTDPPPVSESTGHSHTRTWVTAGLGVGAAVLVAGGVYFGAKSNSAADDFKSASATTPPRSCPGGAGCSTLTDSISTANSDHTVSIVMYSLGAVFAAGAVVSWFTIHDGATSSEKSAVATPLLGPGLLGAQWRTTF